MDALFLNFGPAEARAAQRCIKQLREAGIAAQLYPDCAKIKKQMQFANSESARYVVMIGEQELADGTATVKNMVDGSQATVAQSELLSKLC